MGLFFRKNRVLIQVQDINGNWLTLNTIDDDSGQYVTQRMLESQNQSPTGRVRAMYEGGGLIDVR